jgi:predicted Fe-S protein YdhL (DUF1289 family)
MAVLCWSTREPAASSRSSNNNTRSSSNNIKAVSSEAALFCRGSRPQDAGQSSVPWPDDTVVPGAHEVRTRNLELPGSMLPHRRRMTGMRSARRAVHAWMPCAICPSRQHVARDRACAVGQITSTFPRIPRPCRGALRDRHERWLWDAMDAASRQTIVEVTYGEVVWSWRPDAGAKSAVRPADDGGKKARSPGRARRTPLKPSRREGRMFWLNLW